MKRELVGYADNRAGAVRLPPVGKQWHEFTRDELEGDFLPGYANHAALQGSQPVLIVVKKIGAVLRRLIAWLDRAPADIRAKLPLLVIDDEADDASVDTRGTYQSDEEPIDPEYEPPSIINGLIRTLLGRFDRRAYVAYTATPFANILIPHDTNDPTVGNDLYPKDFIIDLPKAAGYFGAEEFFGRMDAVTGEEVDGLDVVREVSDADLIDLTDHRLPSSLILAIEDFLLAGAAKAQRGQADGPATMLIHTNARIFEQTRMRGLVSERFAELRDEWRYQRGHGIRERFSERWENEFRPVTRGSHPDRDVPFDAIESYIGPFFEAVQVREVNSATGDGLEYDREPSLKAIAIGGNKLSRGLTLEGLLVSFYVRRSIGYDTLMQMGRWFGFRGGYEDVTRIYTTTELAEWFADLAFVEHRLREDIGIYESQGLTPYQVGMRIWQHPTMQVTSRLKRRFVSSTTIAQSYSLSLEQTVKFPLGRLDDLAVQAEANRIAVRDLVVRMGAADAALSDTHGPIWSAVAPDFILDFLRAYRVDDGGARSISPALLAAYIERLNGTDELMRWTVAVRGRVNEDPVLRRADWGAGVPINQMSRTRLKSSRESLGVITEPGHEAIGLSVEALAKTAEHRANGDSENVAARKVRPAEEGLLLLYPISRASGHEQVPPKTRMPLLDDPADPRARDLVGVAISFPKSNQQQPVLAYLEGTAGWRPVE